MCPPSPRLSRWPLCCCGDCCRPPSRRFTPVWHWTCRQSSRQSCWPASSRRLRPISARRFATLLQSSLAISLVSTCFRYGQRLNRWSPFSRLCFSWKLRFRYTRLSHMYQCFTVRWWWKQPVARAAEVPVWLRQLWQRGSARGCPTHILVRNTQPLDLQSRLNMPFPVFNCRSKGFVTTEQEVELVLWFLSCPGTSQGSLATSSNIIWMWSSACWCSACRTRRTHRWGPLSAMRNTSPFLPSRTNDL